MGTKDVMKIFSWFNEYQPNLTNGEELYTKLIQEEKDELVEALNNKNLVEVLDAVTDIYFVMMGKTYFGNKYLGILYSNFTSGLSRFSDYMNSTDNFAAFNECIIEVIKSNYTKELSLQIDWEKAGKVIKGDNFKAPDFRGIIKKYNITLK